MFGHLLKFVQQVLLRPRTFQHSWMLKRLLPDPLSQNPQPLVYVERKFVRCNVEVFNIIFSFLFFFFVFPGPPFNLLSLLVNCYFSLFDFIQIADGVTIVVITLPVFPSCEFCFYFPPPFYFFIFLPQFLFFSRTSIC